MGIPSWEWLRSSRGRLAIMRRAVAGSDAVVVLSRHAAAALRASLGHDAEVIYPGVDLTAFAPGPARRAVPTILCTAAPEIARKNVGLLVEAFGLLRQRYREARLLLMRPASRRAASDAGVRLDAPGIEWLDQDQRADVLARAYAEAWVTALPAVDEAFGMALVESLACGTPVVGHKQGGIPEIVDRTGIGELFEPLEAGALARALADALELSGDPSTPARCRSRAQELSTDAATDRYLSLYHRLRERTGARAR
jgi:glycosyltransferase involved in cell wall biosynthesis